MKKAVCLALGALLLLIALPCSGCGKREKRGKYVIRAEYLPESRTLTAEMEATVVNHSESAWRELKFELYPNAFREGAKVSPVPDLYVPSAYYAGESYGGIEIKGVEGGSFEVGGEDENILTVTLRDELYPDETATLGVSFETTLPKIDHRMGEGEKNVTLTGFYPILCVYDGGFSEYVYAENGDPFVSECADYDVTLTFPSEYTAAGSGVCERREKSGKAVVHMTAENVRDIAFVLGKELKCVSEQTSDGVEVSYCYTDDAEPERVLKLAKESLTFYSGRFAAYPYPTYTVVQTAFPYGGMEYPGLVMIASSLSERDIPAVVAHETAHQWWYALVGSNQFEAAWQDEGLAEYSSALFLDAHPEYGQTYGEFLSRSESGYRAFFSVNSQVTGELDTSMSRPLTSFSGVYEYRNIAYDKGVILFDRLKSVIGEKRFFAGLKEYAERYAGKLAKEEDLIACFKGIGPNAEGLFRSFLDGTCVI